MIRSPLVLEPVFHLGSVPITQPVIATWIIMALMTLGSFLLTRHLALRPGKAQAVAELVTGTIDQQIVDVMRADPAPYRALIGTFFLFVFVANWSGVLPGVEPPTAHFETDAALALIVFAATLYHGVRCNGVFGYLKTFAEPSLIMIPLNLIEQITRMFSLFVRLFGNVMSGVFVIGIILSLAGLLVPIPLMALDLLTGAVQAYIFAILACVFIGSAVNDERGEQTDSKATVSQERSSS